MDVLKNLEEIDVKLKKLKRDFNVQMNSIEFDNKEFHKQLSVVLTKHPELKTVVDFIVFTNDNLERNQKDVKGVVSESLNEMILIKESILKDTIEKQILENKNKNKNFFKGKLSMLNLLNDSKYILTIILGILIMIAFIIVPDTMTKVLGWAFKILT